MGDKIRPEQMEVTTGTTNNDTVPTLGKVEDMIGVENLWDRDTVGSPFLKPHTAADAVRAYYDADGWFSLESTATKVDLKVGGDITELHLNADTIDTDINIWGTSSSNPVFFLDADAKAIAINTNSVLSGFDVTVNGNFYCGGAIGETANRISKIWATNLEITNMPTVGGTSINANAVLDLTAAEVTQLSNIGATVIPTTAWTVVGKLNQDLETISSVAFGSVTVDNLLINSNSITSTSANISIQTIGANDIAITANPASYLNLSAGAITINSGTGGGYTVVNEDGLDTDFRIEGDGDPNLFFVDASTDRVGIGTNAPSVLFDVDGVGKFAQVTVDNLVLNGNTLSSTSGNIILSANSNIVQVGADADTTIELGRAKLGSPVTDIMYLSHYDTNNSTDYAIKQLTSGRTCVNSKAGTQTDLCVNNVGQLTVDATKTTLTNYLNQQGIFAEIFVADASTAQSIATGAGYTKSTAFTTNGQSSNATSDASNDKITITQIGRYRVSGACSATAGKANLTWRGAAFLNNVEQDQVHWKRKMTTTTDSGAMSFTGFIDVTSVPWDLDMRLRHDDGGNQNFTIEYANLNVEYVGAT